MFLEWPAKRFALCVFRFGRFAKFFEMEIYCGGISRGFGTTLQWRFAPFLLITFPLSS